MKKEGLKADWRTTFPGGQFLDFNASALTLNKSHFNSMVSSDALTDALKFKSNVYLICTRSKVRFAPTPIFYTDDHRVSGFLTIDGDEAAALHPFEMDILPAIQNALARHRCPPPVGEIEIELQIHESRRPHTSLFAHAAVSSSDGSRRSYDLEFDLESLAKYMKWEIPELVQLTVEYVGKSVGKKKQRHSTDRLKAHEARTKIEADALIRGNRDVVIVYVSFTATSRSLAGIKEVDMPRPNLISLVEEALIYYFKPPFNKVGIGSYPANNSLRSELSALGVRRVQVRLDTDDLSVSLSSSGMPPALNHVIDLDIDPSGQGVLSHRAFTELIDIENGLNLSRQRLFKSANLAAPANETIRLMISLGWLKPPSLTSCAKMLFAISLNRLRRFRRSSTR